MKMIFAPKRRHFMADLQEPLFPPLITHRLSRLRELLNSETSHSQVQGTSSDGQQNQEAQNTPAQDDVPELVWGQWANWASWTKVL
jgi:hypothetical protein